MKWDWLKPGQGNLGKLGLTCRGTHMEYILAKVVCDSVPRKTESCVDTYFSVHIEGERTETIDNASGFFKGHLDTLLLPPPQEYLAFHVP